MLTNILNEEMMLRMSLVRSSKNSIGFAQMKLAKKFISNLNVMTVNQKWWKTVLTRCKKHFPEPVNYEFDFENQNNQNNKYIFMAELIFVKS